MELLLIVAVAIAMLFGWWVRRNWVEGSDLEPWFMALGAVFLLVMAWGTGADARGAQVVLSLGALYPAYRSAQLFLQRGRERHGSSP